MLLEVSVQNFRSIAETQTFSMLPARGATHVHRTPSKFAPDILQSAALYGPNGSGKSTLVKALLWLQLLVRDSGAFSSDEKISQEPHLLDSSLENKPTIVEIHFVAENNIWRYRVGATSDFITEESLYSRSFETSREKKVFNRFPFEIGPDLSSYSDLLKNKTNPNQLFISKLDQFNAEPTSPAYHWLALKLRVISSVSGFPKSVTARWSKLENNKSAVIAFLKSVDTRVEDISITTSVIKGGSESLDKTLDDFDNPIFKVEKENITQYNLEFFHNNRENGITNIPFRKESLGTQNLFALAGPLLQSLSNGFVLVIDELNQSFHTEILKYIVGLFHSPEANQQEAQIIFTSHDVSVMDVLERDEIWLVDKNEFGATELIALSDFGSPKSGGARRQGAFGKQYLENRFGAVPYTNKLLVLNALETLRRSKQDRVSST